MGRPRALSLGAAHWQGSMKRGGGLPVARCVCGPSTNLTAAREGSWRPSSAQGAAWLRLSVSPACRREPCIAFSERQVLQPVRVSAEALRRPSAALEFLGWLGVHPRRREARAAHGRMPQRNTRQHSAPGARRPPPPPRPPACPSAAPPCTPMCDRSPVSVQAGRQGATVGGAHHPVTPGSRHDGQLGGRRGRRHAAHAAPGCGRRRQGHCHPGGWTVPGEPPLVRLELAGRLRRSASSVPGCTLGAGAAPQPPVQPVRSPCGSTCRPAAPLPAKPCPLPPGHLPPFRQPGRVPARHV